MSSESKSELQFPQFAALARCLLVDSSFRSRREVIKDIKATALFEEIVEAKSMEDAIQRLSLMQFDACYLGPSLPIETTSPFIERMKSSAMSKDCAYILIFRKAVETTVFVAESSAHALVSVGATKQKFSETTVRAILLASESSPWPGVKLDGEGNLLVAEGGIWRKVESDAPPILEGTALGSIAPNAGKEVLESLEAFDDGQGSEMLRLLRKVLESPLPRDDGSAEAQFALHVYQAVEEWRLDKQYLGPRDAARNLRKKLQSFGAA